MDPSRKNIQACSRRSELTRLSPSNHFYHHDHQENFCHFADFKPGRSFVCASSGCCTQAQWRFGKRRDELTRCCHQGKRPQSQENQRQQGEESTSREEDDRQRANGQISQARSTRQWVDLKLPRIGFQLSQSPPLSTEPPSSHEPASLMPKFCPPKSLLPGNGS